MMKDQKKSLTEIKGCLLSHVAGMRGRAYNQIMPETDKNFLMRCSDELEQAAVKIGAVAMALEATGNEPNQT